MNAIRDALRASYSALIAANETLRQLQQQAQLVEIDWETVVIVNQDAILKTEAVLEELEKTSNGADEPLKIQSWLDVGRFDDDDYGPPTHVQELYDIAGALLDDSCASEILGQTLFLGENGKYYTISVEGSLGEADPQFVTEILQDLANMRKAGMAVLNQYFGLDPDNADTKLLESHVYKYTECGAWIKFSERDIKLGSIVEGCDFGTQIFPLAWEDITKEALGLRIIAIEKEADVLWKWANEDDRKTREEAPEFPEHEELGPKGRSS